MTVNPRSVDLRRQAAHVTAPAKVPSIPVLAADGSNLPAIIQAIAETLNVRNGATGGKFEKWVTQRDLESLGLLGALLTQRSVPSDEAGFPVWTSRRKFELVSLEAFGKAVSQFVTQPEAVTPAQLASLQRQINLIQPGVTQAQLSAGLNALRAELVTKVAGDISTAVQALQQLLGPLVNDAMVKATEALQATVRMRGYLHEQDTEAEVWTVIHYLKRYPHVTVQNTEGEKIEPKIVYDDLDTVTITHGRPMAGKARFQ